MPKNSRKKIKVKVDEVVASPEEELEEKATAELKKPDPDGASFIIDKNTITPEKQGSD